MLALAFGLTALGFVLLASGLGALGLLIIFSGTACVGLWGEQTNRQSPGSAYVKADAPRHNRR